MINSAIDEIFSLCMWMLLEPTGNIFFWTASLTALFVLSVGAWALRDDD